MPRTVAPARPGICVPRSEPGECLASPAQESFPRQPCIHAGALVGVLLEPVAVLPHQHGEVPSPAHCPVPQLVFPPSSRPRIRVSDSELYQTPKYCAHPPRPVAPACPPAREWRPAQPARGLLLQPHGPPERNFLQLLADPRLQLLHRRRFFARGSFVKCRARTNWMPSPTKSEASSSSSSAGFGLQGVGRDAAKGGCSTWIGARGLACVSSRSLTVAAAQVGHGSIADRRWTERTTIPATPIPKRVTGIQTERGILQDTSEFPDCAKSSA